MAHKKHCRISKGMLMNLIWLHNYLLRRSFCMGGSQLVRVIDTRKIYDFGEVNCTHTHFKNMTTGSGHC